MKAVTIYWLIGCVITGTSLGLYQKRCPNDAIPTPAEFLVATVAWPAGFAMAIANPTLGPCKASLEKEGGRTCR